MLNRPSQRVTKALEGYAKEKEVTGSSSQIVRIDCDLASFDSVRDGARLLQEKVNEMNLNGIDFLVNNAGVAYNANTMTEDGFDIQMQVNYLSHFLLTKLLFPLLTKAATKNGEARIVHHSSSARYITSFEEKYLKSYKNNPECTKGKVQRFLD